MRIYCLYALLAYLIKFSHFLSTCISCVDCPMLWTNNRKHPNTYICILECFPCVFTMVYHRFNVDEEPPKDPNSSYRRLFKNVSGQRAMGLFGQFLQLLWKNVILRKRQKVRYFSYIYLKPKRYTIEAYLLCYAIK